MLIYDFHTHTFLSDGINSPIELIRCAYSYGYACVALTDHVSYSNIDMIIESVKKDCQLAQKYWDINAIPGVELTNIPAKSINDMAMYAKEKGAILVSVHGETMVEPVEKGTNLEALSSRYVDMLAHPGLLTDEEVLLAVKNGIYLELTRRQGHSLSNGHVAKKAMEAGAGLLINSDAHSHLDLYKEGIQLNVAMGAGLTEKQAEYIFKNNNKAFLKKLFQ
ncbi:MAG: histidinol phosphate phosphatase domain-containing protein [Actinobacteria bacterium]|nr:histidinol phosphate phosphatase domain-containing protein [Actinomycetota bacterium]